DIEMADLLGRLGAASGTDMTMKALYVTEDGDPVMYMQLGLLAGQLPGGKTWMRIDLAKAGKAAGIDLGQLMGGAGQNPSDWLALLRSNGEFSEVGYETVEGTDTTHDHGTTVDVSAPPADQVFDATDLAAQGAASALNGSTR